MNQKVSMVFYPKKSKGWSAGPVPIYLRITARTENSSTPDRTELSTGKKVDVTKWSAEANRLTGKSDQVKTVNEYFDLLELKANNVQNQLLRLGMEITAEKIKLMIEGKPLEKERTIMSVFQEHNDKMK